MDDTVDIPANDTGLPSLPILPSTPSIKRVLTDKMITSTPFAMRIASVHPDSTAGWTVPTLNCLLARELENGIIVDHEELPNQICNDASLPFVVNEDLLNTLSNVYNDTTWISVPTSFMEAGVADWLNLIGAELQRVTDKSPLRSWNANYNTAPLPGMETKRKPDIILMKEGEHPEWSNVDAICEVTSETGFPARLRNTVTQKAYLIFLSQPNRRFTISLSFSSAAFQLVVYDRAGEVNSSKYNINTNALLLLRIIVGLIYSDEEVMGYDQRVQKLGDTWFISDHDRQYMILKTIFSSETLRGRATWCWNVIRDGEQFIIKDSWCLCNRVPEQEILKDLEDIEGITHIVAEMDTKVGGYPDSTAVHRGGTKYLEERVHRRLLIQPIGDRLKSFKSKRELIQAFIDVIQSKFAFWLVVGNSP